MQIKVMQYNILNGFHTQNEPFVFQEDRQAKAVDIVRSVDPDILVLCEASFARPNKYTHQMDYGKIFGFPYSYQGVFSEKSGIAILSKMPALYSKDYSINHLKFLRCIFPVDGLEFMVDAVHPHPAIPEWDKERFIEGVVRDKQVPYVLVGDFNNASPKDKYDKAAMVKGFSRFTQDAEVVVTQMINGKAVGAALRAGLNDSFAYVGKPWTYTVPTDLLSKEKDSGVRLDFILCSKDITVTDAGIIQNDLTNVASDHHPIYAALEI